MNDPQPPAWASTLIGAELPHESAHLHVAGEAAYVDDIVAPQGTLHAALGKSTRAHARILGVDTTAVAAAPGVVAVITAGDIPGRNDVGPVVHDEPILADTLVQYVGQPLFAVAATSVNAARKAAKLAKKKRERMSSRRYARIREVRGGRKSMQSREHESTKPRKNRKEGRHVYTKVRFLSYFRAFVVRIQE